MEARSTPIDPGHDVIVVIDTLVAGVHFPPDTSATDVGHKSLAVNLSDIAAMGGEPLAAQVSLTRETCDAVWLEAFSAGLAALAAGHGVRLGAPLERQGPLCVSVEVIGQVPRGRALLRAGARPGDLVYVTGTLGDAGLALAARARAERLPGRVRAELESRLARPEPRIQAGLALRGIASAAIDVSDGLSADLGHVLAASGVGAVIEAQRLPLSASLSGTLPRERALTLALTAGDDYELCFTVPPARRAELERRFADLPCRITRIGTVAAAPGLRVQDADARIVAAAGGYRHFQ